jgi:hypothetical protein
MVATIYKYQSLKMFLSLTINSKLINRGANQQICTQVINPTYSQPIFLLKKPKFYYVTATKWFYFIQICIYVTYMQNFTLVWVNKLSLIRQLVNGLALKI